MMLVLTNWDILTTCEEVIGSNQSVVLTEVLIHLKVNANDSIKIRV
jgi:hypothetical protein